MQQLFSKICFFYLYGDFVLFISHISIAYLLNGQVDLILRALELYGYNLEYMLNSNDATDEQKQEKISMLKYTYEQVLASQAEQVSTKANNLDNLSSFGKLLSNNFGQTKTNNLKAI